MGEQKRYNVGIIGATGMVGQRFCVLLAEHPWFNITELAASPRSAGKTYENAVKGWLIDDAPMPGKLKNIVVKDASADIDAIAAACDFVFCAVDMKKDEIKELELAYAKRECPVMSNNSAHRATADVPMIIPEVNAHHAAVIAAQRERLGTKRGFISVKSNCSIQSYAPMLTPLLKYGVSEVVVSTYQAISGAGKTFETWPEMIDNVIPYIGGEEEKSEIEPLKVWGSVGADATGSGVIVPATSPKITAQCIRVPVTNGHTAAVWVKFSGAKPTKEQILADWRDYCGVPQKLGLPSAPKQFIHYFAEDNFPQAGLHRNLENGMAVSCGRLREDAVYDYRFVGLSHNTLRGAAGGAVLMAELYAATGYFDAASD